MMIVRGGMHITTRSGIIISYNQMIRKSESRQIIALVFVYGAQIEVKEE